MNFFTDIIQPIVATATKIHHYPQFKKCQFLDDNDKILIELYTEKTTQQLSEIHHLTAYEIIRNKHYKFETKLIVEWKN